MSYENNLSLEQALEQARKRSLASPSKEDSSPPKRLAEDSLHLKLLIPSAAAGAIIGKGGETIAEIQRTTGAKMKMSKANDFYPGTTERVCLISGSKESITDIVSFLTEKIKSRPDPTDENAVERERQIKVIVPNSTAGMIIGKGGAYVKEMKERSGAFIQLSQKADVKLPERVVTLIGEEHSNRIALEMILGKIEADPNSGSCQNISYSDVTGPVANCNMTGSPYANTAAAHGTQSTNGGLNGAVPNSTVPRYDTINVNGHTNLRLTLNVHSPTAPDPWVTSQAMPHINHSLRQAGHSDTVADELTRALGLLAAHGVLQLTQSAATEPITTGWAGETQYGYGTTAAQPHPPTPAPLPGAARPPIPQPTYHQGPKPSDYPAPASPPGPPGEAKPQTEREMQVEEKLVGAVLGPSGRHVVEIQQYSGATVQISKKGVYHPGTRNRVVTIRGTQRAIESAQYLIQQKIQEEETKRERSGR